MTLPLTNPIAIFLVVLAIIVGAPLLFRRLKVPGLVGMILAGVVIGPYGFNILARDASFEIFGQVGILYLMFLAAVEIDMFHLKSNLRPGITFGLLTFILPMAGGIFISRYLMGASWTTSVLLSSMFASHTLISYPVVSKFGLSNTRGAVTAVFGTIVAVLLALLALAEVVDVHTHGFFSWGGLIWLFVMVWIYAAVIGWLFPLLTRWFFRKVSDPVGQYIYILALVFVAALLASLIGLEAILGAFYAGLVLNRFIPARSALMRNISFVGNAIFIPYFLIGVGMLINVQVVVQGWGVLYVAGVMTATALLLKWLAAFSARFLCRLSADDASLMFGLSSGKAAATIAATMIGYQYGLLSEDMMNGAVVMILICCIVASVVTERSAKRIRMHLTEESLKEDEIHSPGYARQVVAVANPLTAEGLTKMAVFMRAPENSEQLTALFVRNTDAREAVTMGRNALQIATSAAADMEIPVEEVERFDLNIVAGLTNTMRERKATDVILGLHHRANMVDSFFGSLTDSLLANTAKMVIMVRCFIPVDTLRKLIVYVPLNAEYETGFHSWIARIANFASQLGCRAVFCNYASTQPYIEQFIREEGYQFSHTFRRMDTWDDFIILSSQVDDDDLLIVVGARKGSISRTSDLDNMPSFLGRFFKRHNVAIIYPSQFNA